VAVASGYLAASERVPGSTGGDGSRTVPFPGAVSKQGVSSLQGYTDRLRNLGMSATQIKSISDNRQLPQSIDIVAPADGFILARNVSPGQHFEHDMEFYRIADLSRVWVIAEVYQQEAPYLRPGGRAQITLREGGRQFAAVVTDSLPQSEAGGGTVKLRLEVDNPHFLLRPEMLVDVEFPVRPREVETGWRFGDRVEIRHGVQPGERVVVAATFLVDSESRLKAPAARMGDTPAVVPTRMAAASAVKDPNCGMAVDPAKAAASGNSLAYRGTTYYFCSAQCKMAFQNKNNATASARKHRGVNND
jgi:Cu(I)/Ag(I) efflux system membrane fusion protein